MSPEAARELSIPDLLRLLNEKLGLESIKLRETPLPPAVSAASLESEIESLETTAHDVLRFILSLRNLLQPVNRLPPELLSRIARSLFHPGDEDPCSILPATQVCRYWRESIISTPENWTLISSRRKILAVLSLERAKAAPLEIHLNMYEIREGPQFLDLLIPYTKSTETLRVIGLLAVEDLAHLLPLLSAPNLKSLTLSDDGLGEWNRSIDPFRSSLHTLGYLSLFGVPLYPSFLDLRTLTELAIFDFDFNLHLDTLLGFLEENRSLTRAIIRIRFIQPSLRSSRRRTAIRNQLQYLLITCYDAMDGQALISSIALSKGAELEVNCRRVSGGDVRVNDVLSGIPMTHLSNLQSPTFMEYHSGTSRRIKLLGPNGTASFQSNCGSDIPFVEFPRLPLSNVQEIRLVYSDPSIVFHPSSFPALETLTIKCGTDISHLFSALLPNPSCFPSLKTLAFSDSVITEQFMEELTQFASGRKNTTSAWLHRVLIIHEDGKFPSAHSIRGLRRHVKTVEVRMDDKFPMDLT